MTPQDKAFLLRFGRRIRALRKQKGWSQEDLGLDCGLDQTYISGIERGQRNVSLHNIRVLSRSLGVTLSYLFEGMEDENREEEGKKRENNRPSAMP